eukprot:1146139_1
MAAPLQAFAQLRVTELSFFSFICTMVLLLLHYLLLSYTRAQILSYTTSSPAGAIVVCGTSNCEITCNGNNACDQSTFNGASASSLTITAFGSNVVQGSTIHCPSNGQCTITGIGSFALASTTINCGINGLCEVTGGGQSSLSDAIIHAEDADELTITGDGGDTSFDGSSSAMEINCPRNAPSSPACIIKLRSDSSPYWSTSLGGPIMRHTSIYADAVTDFEFQCDANSDWDALFGATASTTHPINIYFYGTTKVKCERMKLTSYTANDFFGTNMMGCSSGNSKWMLEGKPCVPWTKFPTWSPTQSPLKSPTSSPTRSPSVFPTQYPTKYPSLLPTTATPSFIPTQPPSTFPTLFPSDFPTLSPSVPTAPTTAQPSTSITTSTPTNRPTFSPTIAPNNDPTSSPTSRIPTQTPSFFPTSSPIPTAATTAQPTGPPSLLPTNSPLIMPPTNIPSQLPTNSDSHDTAVHTTGDKPDKSNGNDTTATVATDNLMFWVFCMITLVLLCVATIWIKFLYRKGKKKRAAALAQITVPSSNEPGFAPSATESNTVPRESMPTNVVRGPGFSITGHESANTLVQGEVLLGSMKNSFPEGGKNALINAIREESGDSLIGVPEDVAPVAFSDVDEHWSMGFCSGCLVTKYGKMFYGELFLCKECGDKFNQPHSPHQPQQVMPDLPEDEAARELPVGKQSTLNLVPDIDLPDEESARKLQEIKKQSTLARLMPHLADLPDDESGRQLELPVHEEAHDEQEKEDGQDKQHVSNDVDEFGPRISLINQDSYNPVEVLKEMDDLKADDDDEIEKALEGIYVEIDDEKDVKGMDKESEKAGAVLNNVVQVDDDSDVDSVEKAIQVVGDDRIETIVQDSVQDPFEE